MGQPELFQLDPEVKPTAVAGVPPDGFSADGQLWGNPLYDWKKHKETGYAWWIQRIAYCKKAYDIVRIDHFRGFDEYFSIPYVILLREMDIGKKVQATTYLRQLKSL